jgi:N-acetylmuramoyl-L-alanine amidase
MFKIIKLKSVLLVLVVAMVSVTLSIGIVKAVGQVDSPRPIYTIVVDSGHGGRDNGCSGSQGSIESEINLEVAKKLKSYIESFGIRVVMTRSDGNGLYESNVDNYKQSDMQKRLEIINNASPDMVISIHQNSYRDSSQRGAQVFYQEEDDGSMGFANSIQSQLLSQLPEARQESNRGDYYILKECGLPAVLVECGYLTNTEEERLLMTEEYQSKVAYAIMCGVVKYFDLCGRD